MIQKKSKINGLTFFAMWKIKTSDEMPHPNASPNQKPELESASQHLVFPNEPQESW
jgi:hypothetical protein